MTGTPQYTAAQLLDIASRYELEGNLEYATQFYRYLAENLVGTPEAAQARTALERLAHRHATQTKRPDPSGQPQPRPTLSATGRPQPASQGPQGQGAPNQSGAPLRTEPTLSSAAPAQRPRDTSQTGYANRPETTGRPGQTQQPQFATPQGTPPAASPHANQPNFAPRAEDDDTPLPRVMRGEEDLEDGVEFSPGYRVGRFLAFTMVLFGWLSLVAGIAFAAIAVAGVAGTQIMSEYGGLPFGVLIGIAGFVVGLLMIFLGSLAQAAYEAANNTRELLEIERAKAGW